MKKYIYIIHCKYNDGCPSRVMRLQVSESTVVVESVWQVLSVQQGHPRRDRQCPQDRHARVVRGEPKVHGHRSTRSGDAAQGIRAAGHRRSYRSPKRRGTLQRVVRKVRRELVHEIILL